ncbi:VOC family protein [Chitinophaga filiformis]|uniref:Glyoxalase superfamily enzyme, possibly 3-demethylubiquinone-9 3-methyltransferase n=1 Tax=Chitinophaga filiformis TaxID=104663 RepID=A0A1G8CGW0_CHIFI|nr:VOC family protein [Chitinophaga filiformis]SDH44638.1 Glyoxalase superfamily enzyme, possibly 3-demethylubiquinone-9 3-methyltransferase [Chitinophaga filiformis]
MQKITPFLWFDTQAEEAAKLYTSLFKNSSIGKISRYPPGLPGQEGKVMTVEFKLDGQDFIALNGGPHYSFTPAVSMFIKCETQEEVDKLWNALSEGGTIEQCGWLRDKFGLSWQVVPNGLQELLQDKDPGRAQRAMTAMMKMKKLDIGVLEEAAMG